MRVIGILAILIIALFVISLSFMAIEDKKNSLSASQGSNTTPGSEAASDGQDQNLIQPLSVAHQKEFQHDYMQQQLQNQRMKAQLSFQQQIEQKRMEYNNLLKQQQMLHEKSLLHNKQQHETELRQQELKKEYLLKQQDSSLAITEKAYEAEMADRLIAFEMSKRLLQQKHQQALVAQQDIAFQHSLITYITIVGSSIFLFSLSYFIVSTRTASRQKQLLQLEQEHIYALKQQESMQETRLKVLESISDLPEQDKKEIIVGLVGLNRPLEELEDKVIEEPPIEIELTELTPPQMKMEPAKN